MKLSERNENLLAAIHALDLKGEWTAGNIMNRVAGKARKQRAPLYAALQGCMGDRPSVKGLGKLLQKIHEKRIGNFELQGRYDTDAKTWRYELVRHMPERLPAAALEPYIPPPVLGKRIEATSFKQAREWEKEHAEVVKNIERSKVDDRLAAENTSVRKLVQQAKTAANDGVLNPNIVHVDRDGTRTYERLPDVAPKVDSHQYANVEEAADALGVPRSEIKRGAYADHFTAPRSSSDDTLCTWMWTHDLSKGHNDSMGFFVPRGSGNWIEGAIDTSERDSGKQARLRQLNAIFGEGRITEFSI